MKKSELLFIIFIFLLLIVILFSFRKSKEKYNSFKEDTIDIENCLNNNLIHNPKENYWFVRNDGSGISNFNQNNYYLYQEISPYSVSDCFLGNCGTDQQCYDKRCVPYCNSEIYNSPCCSDEQIIEVCTRNGINKDICNITRSICNGPVINRMTEELSNNCYLIPNKNIIDNKISLIFEELFFNTPYLYNDLEIKVRVKNLKSGSRGWGFWNTVMNQDMCYIWFMQQDGICPNTLNPFCPSGKEYALNGMYVMIVIPSSMSIDGKEKFRTIKIKDLDEEWNTYNIIWKKEGIKFLVNGKTVYEEKDKSYIPNIRLALHCWVDNAVFAPFHVVQNMKKPRSQTIEYLVIN
jgi:hypothetical protein